MLTILNAVKRAGSTETDQVIAAAEGMEFDTANGPYKIRKEDHQGLGVSNFIKISPSDEAPFYTVTGITQVNEAEVAEPPTPGKKFEIPGD
jgi:branched-chain amino acid transport system substrate-binding protein